MLDTIAAIATATGGGLGVVRVSGPGAFAVMRRVVPSLPAEIESHRVYHGWALAEAGPGGERRRLDEVLCFFLRSPRSYTGEDTVELQGHGGAAVLGELLEAALAAGARLAEPGEFTRRAFLVGRIDLSRAEAVAELVAARSRRAARLAAQHLAGALADRVRQLRARVVEERAEIEAAIDFPDERLETRAADRIARALAAVEDEVRQLATSHARGRAIAEGLDVALVGRPNAGKSSLLNALVGAERALVDAAPGTTRDFVEAECDLGAGASARLVDTAGEREPAEAVEARGIALARRRRAEADAVVVVVDGAVGAGDVEARLVEEARARGARIVVAWNKADLAPPPRAWAPAGEAPIVPTVATRGDGLDALRAALRAGLDGDDAPVTVTSTRQRAALAAAADALSRARALLDGEQPLELCAVDVKTAHDRLGEITGETADEALLDALFARFCIGK